MTIKIVHLPEAGHVWGVLYCPVQQFLELPGFPSKLAMHADLHPTGKPEESKGPLRGAGPRQDMDQVSC
jgi:hypothetical protein